MITSVVVLGGGSRAGVIKREVRGTPRSPGSGEFHSAVEVNASEDPALVQSTMTIRAKKSDIDTFAKGKLKPEEFRKKVVLHTH